MKVKLLKKIRKRFSIIHMPKGFVDNDGDLYDYNLFKLVDKSNDYSTGMKYQKLRKIKDLRIKERKDILAKYIVGTYNEWDKGGYFKKPL